MVVGLLSLLVGSACGPQVLGDTAADTSSPDDEGASGGACELFCDTQVACDPDPQTDRDDCMTLCTLQVASAAGNGDEGCSITLDRGLRCVADLTCPEYEEWKAGQKGETYPCSHETDEADLACQ